MSVIKIVAEEKDLFFDQKEYNLVKKLANEGFTLIEMARLMNRDKWELLHCIVEHLEMGRIKAKSILLFEDSECTSD